MKRLLPFVALTLACRPDLKVPAPDTAAVTPRAQTTAAAVLASPPDTPVAIVEAPESEPLILIHPGLVQDADSVAWNQYPRVLINDCIGEACSMQFEAVACRDVPLRTAPFDTAAFGDTIRRGDTVSVVQTDLHMESPGIIVFRRAYDLDWESGEDGRYPASDTLRFAEGDTLFLLRYIGLGRWQGAFRGRKVMLSGGFWFAADSVEGSMIGSSTSDSSVAVAQSYPVLSSWWHVEPKLGHRGFYKEREWRQGLKPEGKYWESTRCPEP